MKVLLALLLAVCITNNLFAQNNKVVKIYLNGAVSPFKSFEFNTYYGREQRTKTTDFLSPSIAYQRSDKKQNAHEIELNRISIRSEDRQVQQIDTLNSTKSFILGQKITTTTIACRYEYILNIGKKKNWTVKPAIGFAVMPYYHRFNSVPYVSIDYPTSATTIGIMHAIIPRVNISLSKKLLLDINIPVSVLDVETIKQIIHNPSLRKNAQEYTIWDLTAFPNYITARIGLGLKI